MEADNPSSCLCAPSERAFDRFGLVASFPAPALSLFLSASSVRLPCGWTLLRLAAGAVPLGARQPADFCTRAECSTKPEVGRADSSAASRLPRRFLGTPDLCVFAGPSAGQSSRRRLVPAAVPGSGTPQSLFVLSRRRGAFGDAGTGSPGCFCARSLGCSSELSPRWRWG